MDDSTFNHHVNDSKNDFSKWIKDVFEDYKTANSLQTQRNRQDIINLLEKELIKARLEKLNKETSDKFRINKGISKLQKKIKKNKKPRLQQLPENVQNIKNTQNTKKIVEKFNLSKIGTNQTIENKQILLKADGENEEKIDKFITPGFLQGLAIGILLTAITGIIYIRFIIK